MARKKAARRLPSLRTCPSLQARDHKGARLVEILRKLAINNQRAEPQLFYPIRDVAGRFRVPASTVARVYSQLEDEGILASVRGSKTVLQGLSSGRHFNVLGFIGMPASVSAFVTFQDYRMFFIRTRRELRHRGFAVAMVLFEPRHIKTGQLLARMEKHNFDTVVWYRPDTSVRDMIAQLKDAGVQIVGVSDGALPAIPCRYEVRRETAIKAILRDWRSQSGIESAVIVRGPRSSSAKEEMLEALIEEEHLTCAFESVGHEELRAFLESLGRTKNRGIIFTSGVASMFAFRAPQALMKLTTYCRIMFTEGPPSIPFAQVVDVPADLVVVDWQLFAEKIVSDLISKKAFNRTEMTVFEAQAVLHAPLNQYAQSL